MTHLVWTPDLKLNTDGCRCELNTQEARKDNGELQDSLCQNDNTKPLRKNVVNRQGVHGSAEVTTEWQLVALAIRNPGVGFKTHGGSACQSKIRRRRYHEGDIPCSLYLCG